VASSEAALPLQWRDRAGFEPASLLSVINDGVDHSSTHLFAQYVVVANKHTSIYSDCQPPPRQNMELTADI